ncbi:MAG: mechanosensitive ion channel family protein [Firmicutes bacterium]|nr:mechanosensitive ion channel family protein [Bacillota bacterium]
MDINQKLMNLLEHGIATVVVLLAGLLLIKFILGMTKKTLKKTSLDGAIHTFIISAMRIILYIILVVVLLGVLEVPTTPLITVLGAGGAAIALALKDSLGNIAGGLLILVNQPFRKGDEIDIDGTYGEVEQIDLFVTTLRTYDNKVITIPNGSINTSVIVNYSLRERRRVDCKFGISYDSDLALAKSVLLEVAASNPDIYKDPAPFAGVASHGESSVVLDLKVWCDTDKYYSVKYYLTEQVKLAFDEADISIPYPQMDVRVIK